MPKIELSRCDVAIQRSGKGVVEGAQIRRLPVFRGRASRKQAVAAGVIAFAAVSSSAGASVEAAPHLFEPTRTSAPLHDRSLSARLEERLIYLRDVGLDDGVVLSRTGKARLLTFIEQYEVSRRPELTLRDDGGLRALWRDDNGSEASAKFSDHDLLEIAVLMRRDGRQPARWAGIDDEAGFLDVLYGLDAHQLVLG